MKPLSSTTLSRLAVAGCGILMLLATLPLIILEQASVGLWLMQVLPLGLLIKGVYGLDKRALQWLGFLVLFFMVQGILQIFVTLPVYRLLGAANTLTCILLFFIAITGIRRPSNPESVQ